MIWVTRKYVHKWMCAMTISTFQFNWAADTMTNYATALHILSFAVLRYVTICHSPHFKSISLRRIQVCSRFGVELCCIYVKTSQRDSSKKDISKKTAKNLQWRLQSDKNYMFFRITFSRNSLCGKDKKTRAGLHNIRPAGPMRPARSFLAARENSVAENVAKARLRIITCPFRISSTLWRNRLLRPAASLCWSIWPFELSELCRPAIKCLLHQQCSNVFIQVRNICFTSTSHL